LKDPALPALINKKESVKYNVYDAYPSSKITDSPTFTFSFVVHFDQQSTNDDGFVGVALLKINGKAVVTEIREMKLAAYFTQNNINELYEVRFKQYCLDRKRFKSYESYETTKLNRYQ
jgi:hypothetical protein